MMFSFLDGDLQKADVFVDLGTANTLVAVRDKGILLNEPTLIAYSNSLGKPHIIAIGNEAKKKMDKNPGNIYLYHPLKDGVIADYETTETMLKHFLSQIHFKKFWKRPRLVISLPYGVTEVEKKAAVEAGKAAGAKEVILVDEPMMAALGADLPIKDPEGNMIVDIGGGTTEIAIIALADIVYCQALRIGGHEFDRAIVEYLKRHLKITISESLAEELKTELATAMPKKDLRSKLIQGRDTDTGLVKSIEVTSDIIGRALDDSINKIISGIHSALEQTPPELVSDIIERGIVLAGGGALIKDLPARIENEIRIPVRVAPHPLMCIAHGGEIVLSDPDLLNKIRLEV